MKTDKQRNDGIMAGQREYAEKEGRCPSTKSFNLRARGTALVVCGKELGHDVTGRDMRQLGQHSRVIREGVTVLIFVIAVLMFLWIAPVFSASSGDAMKIQPDWTRRHVQRLLDEEGVRVVVYRDEVGAKHIVKDYPLDGGTVRVEYTRSRSALRVIYRDVAVSDPEAPVPS